MVRSHVAVGAFLVVVAFGCHRHQGAVPSDVEAEMDDAIRRFGAPNQRNPWSCLDERIMSIPDGTIRAACRSRFQDKLFAVELSGEDYERLARLFRNVELGLSPCREGRGEGWTIVDEYRAQIRRFTWMRRELDRWKAKVVSGEAGRLAQEDPAKYERWRRAYRFCLHEYEWLLMSCERKFEPLCRAEQVSVAERARAKSLLEEYLGRPLRTDGELDCDKRQILAQPEFKALQQGP